MPTVNYSIVRRYEAIKDQFGKPQGSLRPMLRVRLADRQVGPEFLALVDSGADLSLFPLDAARDAGVDLSQCRIQQVRGVGGTTTVHVCRVGIEAEGRQFTIDAAFTDDPTRQSLALLGRRGIFTAFLFGCDEREGDLLVEPYA